jgi:hypothetical protein
MASFWDPIAFSDGQNEHPPQANFLFEYPTFPPDRFILHLPKTQTDSANSRNTTARKKEMCEI